MNGHSLSPVNACGEGTVKNVQRNAPYIEILEQPASKALRFRYECEGRSAGSIPGVHSTPENKTYPRIRVSISMLLSYLIFLFRLRGSFFVCFCFADSRI
jgi:hypothetical protein